MYYFFFFKQKTAYEMRISDWSSDVCSSDLLREAGLELLVLCPLDAQEVRQLGDLGVEPGQLRVAPAQLIGEEDLGDDEDHQHEDDDHQKIGRASCRERVCQYV